MNIQSNRKLCDFAENAYHKPASRVGFSCILQRKKQKKKIILIIMKVAININRQTWEGNVLHYLVILKI